MDGIGAISSNDKKDLESSQVGGMYMAYQPQQPTSIYADTGVHLTEQQRTGSIFS